MVKAVKNIDTLNKLFFDNKGIALRIARSFYNKAGRYNIYQEDVEQQALLALWLACKDYKSSAKFSTFAYSVIRNKLINYFRDLDQSMMFEVELEDYHAITIPHKINNNIILTSLIFKAKLNNSQKTIIFRYLSGDNLRDMGRKENKSWQFFQNEFNLAVNKMSRLL